MDIKCKDCGILRTDVKKYSHFCKKCSNKRANRGLENLELVMVLGYGKLKDDSKSDTYNGIIKCPVCKTERKANLSSVKHSKTRGACPSCSNIGILNGAYRHGENSNTNRTRTNKIWNSMRTRCMCVTNKDYPRYGGRGITICSEWDNYEVFKQWAGGRLEDKNMSIERIDNNKGYSPDNCAIVPLWVQTLNRRHSVVGLLKAIEIVRDIEDIPPYNGKGVFIAKKHGVDRMIVTHLNNPRTKAKYLELLSNEPKWFKEYKEKYELVFT